MNQETINVFTWYANRMEELVKYGWNSSFKEKQLKEAHEMFVEELKKRIDFHNLTIKECRELRFGKWDDNRLMLIPLYLYDVIPIGMELTSISGEKVVFDGSNISSDHRFGCLAYGIFPKA